VALDAGLEFMQASFRGLHADYTFSAVSID